MNFIKGLFTKAFGFVTRMIGKAINTCVHLTAPLFMSFSKEPNAPKFGMAVVGRALLGLIGYTGVIYLFSTAAVLLMTGITYVLALLLPLLIANLIALVLTLVAVHYTIYIAKNVSLNDVFFPSFVLGTEEVAAPVAETVAA